ncbi:MAG TPA: HAD family hydrolase [Ktedonosporobacter sp.]|nr:HAD family hydrolase [Ktedonosporobacter sp.]
MNAVIFDMDGVIVDSELHWKNLEGFFLSSLVSSWTDADQSRIIGVSMDHVYTLLVSEYGMQKSREQFLAQYQEMANEIYGKKVALLPGVEDLLTKLRQHHIPVALASSSPRSWINIVLRRFNLRASFQAVVSADDLNGEGKPSPAIYLFTASSLGVPPTQCIAIEDSKNGVLSAKNAGMFCIGLRNGFNEEQDISRADLIIHGFAELDFNIFLKDY